MVRNIAAALALVIASSAPALAQSDITVPPTAAWRHAQSGLILRSQFAGLGRVQIKDLTKSELDVQIRYGSEPTHVDIYVFRPADGDVPLWFDRADTQIALNPALASPVAKGPPTGFAPPRATTASALRRVYVPGKGPFTATGIAMMPLGEWLVTVRMSSTVLDAAALETRLGEAIAALGWPSADTPAPAAVPVTPCATSLRYARDARLKKPDMAASLLGALLAGTATAKPKPDKAATKAQPPTTWCREGKGERSFGVYRGVTATDGFMLALGDAGQVASVYPAFSLDDKNPGYTATLGLLDRTLIFPNFDKLPRPEALLGAVTSTTPVSSTSRDGKNVTIDPGVK